MATHEDLKRWREDRDLTQTQCAERAGMRQSAWSEIENGNRPPSLRQAVGIARVTNGHVSVSSWPAAQPKAPPAPQSRPARSKKRSSSATRKVA